MSATTRVVFNGWHCARHRTSRPGPAGSSLIRGKALPQIASVVVGTGTKYRIWLQLQAMRRVGADQTTKYVLSRMEMTDTSSR